VFYILYILEYTHFGPSIKIVTEIIQSIVYCCLKLTNVGRQLLNRNYTKNGSNSVHRMIHVYTWVFITWLYLRDYSTYRIIAVTWRKMTVSMMHFVF